MRVVVYRDGEQFGEGKLTLDAIEGVDFPSSVVERNILKEIKELPLDQYEATVDVGGHKWQAEVFPEEGEDMTLLLTEREKDDIIDQLYSIESYADEWHEYEQAKEHKALTESQLQIYQHVRKNTFSEVEELPDRFWKKFEAIKMKYHGGLSAKETRDLAHKLAIKLEEGEPIEGGSRNEGENSDTSEFKRFIEEENIKYYTFHDKWGGNYDVYRLYDEEGECVGENTPHDQHYDQKVEYIEENLEYKDEMWVDIWNEICPMCGKGLKEAGAGYLYCPYCDWDMKEYGLEPEEPKPVQEPVGVEVEEKAVKELEKRQPSEVKGKELSECMRAFKASQEVVQEQCEDKNGRMINLTDNIVMWVPQEVIRSIKEDASYVHPALERQIEKVLPTYVANDEDILGKIYERWVEIIYRSLNL